MGRLTSIASFIANVALDTAKDIRNSYRSQKQTPAPPPPTAHHPPPPPRKSAHVKTFLNVNARIHAFPNPSTMASTLPLGLRSRFTDPASGKRYVIGNNGDRVYERHGNSMKTGIPDPNEFGKLAGERKLHNDGNGYFFHIMDDGRHQPAYGGGYVPT